MRLVTLLGLLLLTGACAGGEEPVAPEEVEAAVVDPAGPTVQRVLPGDVARLQVVQSPEVGAVVADREQYTLYRNEKDGTNPPSSTCLEPECTLVWVPLLARGGQFLAEGVDQSLLSTMKRPDGLEQVTLAGRPLYRYVDDEQAGDAVGNGVDGQWFAVAPNGDKARP
ncbi:hypothetical protein SK571_03750 [Lentzea sp. BCCO 10_0798]|uniref:Lipoprotein n=1 Tax=Lentzea kristufekii TaxID=3095430 RepID=A0ABU4TJP6_9PSEU|nr:hypothetical protein [Lentzea sp. BCCO 10_0798]MDX8048485.1 hypothetical protein [Lentzea sp. BCCO 10_0798]